MAVLTSALLCLSLNIYGEDKFNGYDGMASVAIVTMTRANNDPEKVCDVVFAKKQFSWANPLTTASPSQRKALAPKFLPKPGPHWEAAKEVAYQALTGTLDSEIVATVGEADHYYNPELANPYWAKIYPEVAMIGEHRFMLSPRTWN